MTLPVETLLKERNSFQEIGFGDFLIDVFPHLKNHLPLVSKAVEFVSGLESLSKIQPDDSIGYIRGGAVRRYFLQMQYIEDSISEQFKNLPEKYRGSKPLTKQVLDRTFGLKDVDIHIERADKFRQNDDEFEKILIEKAQLNDYKIEIEKFTDKNMSFFHINYLDLKSGQPVLSLSVNDYPVEDNDIRGGTKASKFDQLARGKIFLKNHQPVFAYDKEPLTDFVEHEFIDKKYHGFDENMSVTEFIGGLRASGFASFHTDQLLRHPDIASQNIINFMVRYFGNIKDQFDDKKVQTWIKKNQKELQQRQILIISDALYPCTFHPITFLTMAYLNGYLQYLPIGKLIKTEVDLVSVIKTIAELNEKSITDSFLELWKAEAENPNIVFDLVLALMQLKHLPIDIPLNKDTIVDLLNPLK